MAFDDFGNNLDGLDGMEDPSNYGDLPSTGFLSQVPDASLPAGLGSFSSQSSPLQQYLQMLRNGGNSAPSQPTVGKAGNMADLASTLGAFSSGEKANRIIKGNLTQNYDRLMLDAQKDRNSNESDSLQKLAQTSYIMGGGSKFKPPTLSLNGKTYQTPDLGFGPTPVTDAEKQGAAALQPQLQHRLEPGGSYAPQPLSSYADPGIAEKISSYGAAGVGGLGTIASMMGSGGQTGGNNVGSIISELQKAGASAGTIASIMSKLGVGGGGAGASSAIADGAGTGTSSVAGDALGMVGKYAGPVAGAALGTYGVIKNNSVGSDTLSGAGAGASIGSMVMPGVGTAVGAGVGALVGALRGAFSVTGKEHAGRDAQAQITQNLSKIATPQQIADSKKAGWPDPNQALSLIVMRDGLIKSGVPGPQAEAQAESIMHGMWDAEKGGADKVSQAFSPINSMMSQQNLGSQLNASLTTPTSGMPAGYDAFSRGAYRG